MHFVGYPSAFYCTLNTHYRIVSYLNVNEYRSILSALSIKNIVSANFSHVKMARNLSGVVAYVQALSDMQLMRRLSDICTSQSNYVGTRQQCKIGNRLRFLPRDHDALCQCDRPSVCPSVRHTPRRYCVATAKHIKRFFHLG